MTGMGDRWRKEGKKKKKDTSGSKENKTVFVIQYLCFMDLLFHPPHFPWTSPP